LSQAERAFYTLDAELRLVSASPNTLRIWGRTAREIAGKKLVELFPFVADGPMHEALKRALHTYQPVRLQVPSVLLGKAVDVEIYPVSGGLQVSFQPTRSSTR
jgi:PAS domain-containing protein